jgi:hypothetical protein
MANMLRTNTTLVDLNLSGNPTDKDGSAIQCFGALAIALALRENNSLRALRLAASGIESVGATYIAHALVVNTTLQALDLEGVRAHEIVARQPMVPPIRKEDTNVDPLYFEELVMSVGMRKKDELELRNAMDRQSTLKSALQRIAGPPAFDGRIGRDGASALAQALKKNTTLTELSVAQNNICNEGTELLVASISEHPRMIALDVSGARMNEQVVGKLVKILNRRSKENNSLRFILVTGSELGRDAVSKLQDAATPHNITIHAFEDSPLLELEELDADDDPMKEIREVERKVQEKIEQESKRSRFVIYSEDFPYESKALALKDNFNRCPEIHQEKLRKVSSIMIHRRYSWYYPVLPYHCCVVRCFIYKPNTNAFLLIVVVRLLLGNH